MCSEPAFGSAECADPALERAATVAQILARQLGSVHTLGVTKRPTEAWRQHLEDQEAAVAAGKLDPESNDAWAIRLFPAAFTADVDKALALFEQGIEQADLSRQHDIWVLIKGVIDNLNAVSKQWELIETGEREDLCKYIDDALTEAGADLDAVADGARIERNDLADEWREW